MVYDFRSSDYFQTLPQIVKESIMQFGLEFDSEEELKTFAKSYEETE